MINLRKEAKSIITDLIAIYQKHKGGRMKGLTQPEMIRKWLRTHKYITQLDCNKLGIGRLAARAHEMPDLVSDMIEVVKANGRIARVARYSMIRRNH